jgi:transcriptional regulator with XRE-family HTH domain
MQKLPASQKAFEDDVLSVDRGLTPFGTRLVMALQAKGMSDSELAKTLGIAQPNIHTLKYKTDRPRHKTVVKIARALGVTVETLLPPVEAMGFAAGKGESTADFGGAISGATRVFLVIENSQGRQTIRIA